MPSVVSRVAGMGNFFRAREKSLILLVLMTFGFVCFGAIFFLPSPQPLNGVSGGKIQKVYQGLRDAGQDFIIPPPPVESRDNPNVRHGVLDRPDPHRVDDKARLLAQIEMDVQMEDMKRQREGQQVLPKPNQGPAKPSEKSKNGRKQDEVIDLNNEEIKKPGKHPEDNAGVLPPPNNNVPVRKNDGPAKVISNGDPMVQGGEDQEEDARKKRDKVKAMMKHAWDGYARYGWGQNEVKPISRRGHSASIFGSAAMGATIVDSMDTLYIMGMMEEFQAGREWIENSLDFNKMAGDVSVFETNIRYVGGLLSAYALTGDDLFREKAQHVTDKLLPAFNTPTGIPYGLVNMRSGLAKNYGWASGGSSILSEFGTMHMEFAYMSDVSGDKKYVSKVEKIRDVLMRTPRPKRLYPNYLNPKTGKWGQSHTSMGALGDSFYEYLLKEWIRSGKKDKQAKQLMDEALLDVERELVKTSPGGLVYFAEQKYGRLEHKMDELACFGGGMYGLAAHEEQDEKSERWMGVAEGITNTCHEAFDRSDTKLPPEAFRFTDSVEARAVKSTERYYILRPETVESYFYMWRLTHDQKYRDWGWEAVQAIEKHCKAEAGYSGVKNVYAIDGPKDDVQQSFLLAETFKYLYLLFSDDSLISLDEWVFNTEAHPLPVKGNNAFYRQA